MFSPSSNNSEPLSTAYNPVKYAFLISFLIPSLLLSLLIFYHIIKTPKARSVHSHVIIVLLCVNFLQVLTDLPILISVFHIGHLRPPLSAFCTFWVWYDFSLNAVGIGLMAFASIERQVIIFKFNFFHDRMKLYALHYAPIIFVLCWTPLFYIVTVVLSPTCEQTWNYDLISCGQPCFVLENKYLSGFDFICHLLIPILIITISNITLCIRVIYQKRKVQQASALKRQQKMTIQLISIAARYIFGWLPTIITQLVQLYFNSSFLAVQLESILFSIYFIPLLLPAVCLRTMPHLIKRLRHLIIRKP